MTRVVVGIAVCAMLAAAQKPRPGNSTQNQMNQHDQPIIIDQGSLKLLFLTPTPAIMNDGSAAFGSAGMAVPALPGTKYVRVYRENYPSGISFLKRTKVPLVQTHDLPVLDSETIEVYADVWVDNIRDWAPLNPSAAQITLKRSAAPANKQSLLDAHYGHSSYTGWLIYAPNGVPTIDSTLGNIMSQPEFAGLANKNFPIVQERLVPLGSGTHRPGRLIVRRANGTIKSNVVLTSCPSIQICSNTAGGPCIPTADLPSSCTYGLTGSGSGQNIQ